MAFKDETLSCQDCGQKFTWSAGEQQFFYDKGFTRPPIRCPECRKKKKEKHDTKPATRTVSNQKFEIKCKQCGKTSEVPFQPKNPNDIFCADCFEKEKSNQDTQPTNQK